MKKDANRMMNSTKLVAAAAFVVGAAIFAPRSASAMPVAPVVIDAGAAIEQAHAVRRCDRWGRCWWTTAGHSHRRYGYGRHRYYGHRYGWRGGRHYGYGRRHWR